MYGLTIYSCCASAKGVFAINVAHAGIGCSCNKLRYKYPFTALLFAFMPLLRIVTNKGVLLYLSTPPYTCTLKQFCYDALVVGASSKSTPYLFPAPLSFVTQNVLAMCHNHICAMPTVPIVLQSIAVSACASLLVKYASSASHGAQCVC